MLILLPNELNGIYQLDEKINTVDLEDFLWNLNSDDDVEVQLPRFNMKEQIDLKDTLKKVRRLFIRTYTNSTHRLSVLLSLQSNDKQHTIQ